MEKEVIFALISTALFFIGIIPYFRDVIKKRTIPHPFSYIVWGILTGFNSYILYTQNEHISLIPTVISTISCMVLTIYGFKMFRLIQINTLDYLFLSLAILVFPLYFLTEDALKAVIFTVIIDFLAYLATIKKWWLQPWTETIFTFLIVWVNHGLIIFTQETITWEWSLFWWYMFISNFFVFFMILFRRYYLKWWHSIFD